MAIFFVILVFRNPWHVLHVITANDFLHHLTYRLHKTYDLKTEYLSVNSSVQLIGIVLLQLCCV